MIKAYVELNAKLSIISHYLWKEIEYKISGCLNIKKYGDKPNLVRKIIDIKSEIK
jgi:hypothetical protein